MASGEWSEQTSSDCGREPLFAVRHHGYWPSLTLSAAEMPPTSKTSGMTTNAAAMATIAAATSRSRFVKREVDAVRNDAGKAKLLMASILDIVESPAGAAGGRTWSDHHCPS